jgi:hypothetical protein
MKRGECKGCAGTLKAIGQCRRCHRCLECCDRRQVAGSCAYKFAGMKPNAQLRSVRAYDAHQRKLYGAGGGR